MTNYNDGFWHGWNGGECPVHPRSVVEIVYQGDDEYLANNAIADHCEWNEGCDSPIIAFRVIKEHKEPREFWAIRGVIFRTKDDAESVAGRYDYPITDIIHVREVLK